MQERSELPTYDGATTGRVGDRDVRFRCRRSGNSCRVHGYVWLEPGEDARLAKDLSSPLESFRARKVRTVVHPSTGALREALLERADGRCVLLAGANECLGYADRPLHCRRFPSWAALEDPRALARTLELCPGLELAEEST